MRDSKLKSNSQLLNNQFKSNKNIIGKNRTISFKKNQSKTKLFDLEGD